jgi:hypothetical protein
MTDRPMRFSDDERATYARDYAGVHARITWEAQN